MEPNDMNIADIQQNFSAFPAETPLAMAYVPVQKLHAVYEPYNALMQGTLFPELDKPWLGGRAFMNKMNDSVMDARMPGAGNNSQVQSSFYGRGNEK